MRTCLLRLGLAALAHGAVAAPAPALSPVALSVQRAIEGNPAVAASFNAFRAAHEEIDVAAGAWKPHVDTSADAGRRTFTYSIPVGGSTSPEFTQTGVRLELSQLLWDGLATRHEVDRLGHAQLQRWFEFLATTERLGLDAARAYYDVVRTRRFVELAEENYVQHKVTFDQVRSRVQAGVGRGVDLEQVGARLAQAESTLVAERAGLHDATARYLRIVGTLPPAESLSTVPTTRPLPATAAAALDEAQQQSPAVAASIENLRGARSAAEGLQSAFQPRVEARAFGADGRNLDGNLAERRDAGAGIVLTWNLFNGGSDAARQRQYASLLTQAENLRDQACDDTREHVAVAFNDVHRLDEQLRHLDRNVVAIRKARDAYRQQFDIGRRSLLDLLNAESELYTARRAYADADADLATAVVRTHAAMGTLVAALGLRRPDAEGLAPQGPTWGAAGDASVRCPVVPIDVGGATKDELDARAGAIEAARAASAAAAAASIALPGTGVDAGPGAPAGPASSPLRP
jgi:adhesin transport system outer membrane protein